MFITLKKWRAIVMCILLSLPFTLVNFSGYLKGNIPSVFQAISSIVFLLIWFIIALSMSQKNMDIIKISSWFWGGGAILSFLGYFAEIGFIYIPALLIFAGPLYGLRYFLTQTSQLEMGR
ncbi:hypothetical protein GCM10010912_67370 [Paenibacillus albidus]|uniref:Uncharacterized protein n=1 Tax=Paenibacillus albidus TaxID=2041023 RepID=A0A917D8V0_9BACL|nr:hypothetical protein [Paenibacillus albidus]GGG13469.1 hypothetical protein GCM10010912_67370 [Paenibacillus albidus]